MPEGLAYPFDGHADLDATVPSPALSRARAPGDLPGSLAAAVTRGALNRCPACTGAPLFARFLKPQRECPACGRDWTRHRADDFPAYIVILLTGHLLAPAIIAVETKLSPPLWFDMVLWPLTAAAILLLLLQPAKGAIIAAQWRLGMHGFSEASPLRRDPARRNE